MSSITPTHAAGQAAYTGDATSSQGPSESSSPSQSAEAKQARAPSNDGSAEKPADDPLTTEERKAIKENFPEDPELSMRLYGRGRGTETVSPGGLGENLDITG